MSIVLAHLSDLHVSRFGEHVSSLRTRAMHGKKATKKDPWLLLAEPHGWRVEAFEKIVRLVDELGIEHARRRVDPSLRDEVCAELSKLAHERTRTEHHRLAKTFPSLAEVERMLVDDPGNTNLLFCRAAHRIRLDKPDYVVLTGDVTDDGVGYDLVLAGFAPFVAKKRLLAVPGNHDIYDSPLFVVPRHARRTQKEKRAAWATFADALGLPSASPWIRELGEGVVVCGLDSCIPARTPMSASGAVEPRALAELEALLRALPADTCRLAMLHHHVVNLPTRSIGLAPLQIGLRLRNARAVYEFLCEQKFSGVLNGHRHLGYRYHPSHAPLFISAPSATLGCRSGTSRRPFYWRIEVARRAIRAVTERLI